MEAGVDTANQRVAEYCSQQSSKKWYMCLFTQYLDIAINNAFVFHCLALKKYTEDTCTDGKYHFHGLLDFKATLVDELLERGRVVVPTHAPVLSAVATLAKAMPGYTAPSTAGFHMPVFLRRVSKSGTDKPVVGTCSYASCPTTKTGKKGRVQARCDTCQVHLCLQPERNCFYAYHEALRSGGGGSGGGGSGGGGSGGGSGTRGRKSEAVV